MRCAWLPPIVVLAGCGRVGFDSQGDAEVSGPLVAQAAYDRANFNSNVAITASGGVPPYAFAVTSGRGEVDARGVFRAGSRPSKAIVIVSDAAGETREVRITVGGELLFGVGGYTTTGAFSDVYRSADAVSWTRAGDVPAPRGGGLLWVQDDALYWAGGDIRFDAGTTRDEIWRSRDGATWEPIGVFPNTIAAVGTAWFGGRIWVGPGIEGPSTYNTKVWSSADGIAWRAEPPFPVAAHMVRLLEYDDALYAIAGHGINAALAQVYKLVGTSWQPQGMVENAGEYHGVAVYKNQMWVAGGNGLGDIVQTSSDGITWTRTGARMPLSREEGELVELNDRLYVVAGRPRTTVYTDDGTSWTLSTPYPIDCVGTHVVAFSPR